jgi:acyl-CoA reductase-like NAD-dependent aldehyde dehydrogenase
MTGQSLLFIHGIARASASGAFFDTIDPASGSPITAVARGGADDVDAAVESARRALAAWRRWRPVDRGRLLTAISSAILRNRDELAALESRDTGKPLAQASADVDAAARYFEFYAGLVDKILGTTIPLGDDFVDYTLREPLGVSAQIVPWNYPLQIGTRGIAPALAAGNTVVVKPASEAPLTLGRIAALALDEGLPVGVLNVVTGPGSDAGAALAGHPGINQLTFTGSVDVGVGVMTAAAKNVVPVVLELGGKSPNVVFADADLDAALPVILRSILQNAGQTCSAGSRLLVHESVADEVLSRLAEKMRAVKIGPGIENPDLGPLISQHQVEHVHGLVTGAVDEGAEVIAGGASAPEAESLGGFFYQPTLLTCSPENAIARDEVFGPVLAALTFADDAEAIELANDTDFGLVTGVWSRDVSRAHVVAREIHAGQIFVNGYGAGGGVEIPFGGYRKSGFGREKGVEGINSYLQTKNVCVRLT